MWFGGDVGEYDVSILGESLHLVYFYTESVRNATRQLYYVEVECVVYNSTIITTLH